MRSIINIVLKEALQLRRDSLRLRLMIIAPLLQLILLGYAANLDVRKIPLIVYDADRSEESREMVDRFLSSGYFILTGYASQPNEIDRAITRGDASIALVFPADFSERLMSAQPAPLQAIADGTDATFSARGLNYAAMIIKQYSSDIILQRLGGMRELEDLPGVSAEVRVWYNPELDSRWFLTTGVLALVLMVLSLVGTAMTVVREKEMGTLEQLIVTPIRPYHLIIGKLVPNAVVGMVVTGMVLVLVQVLFGVPLRGSVVHLLAQCFVFLLSMQGLGLFISTESNTQQQAMMSAMFFVMFPMILLSGFIFPIENMPEAVQAITYLIPLRYFFIIMRGIMLKGSGLSVLWEETLAMGAIAVFAIGLSVLGFRKRMR